LQPRIRTSAFATRPSKSIPPAFCCLAQTVHTTFGPASAIQTRRWNPAPVVSGDRSIVAFRRAIQAGGIDRKSFSRLAEIGEHREVYGERWFGLSSGGTFFAIIPSVVMEV
jgi:hypothetical protein